MPERLTVTCRPARPSDTPDVLAFTARIWDGDDYVPHVWEEWLADPEGLLAVAEHETHVVGLGKLSRLSEQDWWMEGLRVNPDFEGRNIASQLNDYLLKRWEQQGSGTVRLATNSKRLPVHHMCARNGFEKVLELTYYVSPTLKPAQAGGVDDSHFRLLESDEIPEAALFARQSASLQLYAGLMDLHWRWAPPREAYLEAEVSERRAYWWRDGRGVIILGSDTDEDNRLIAFPKLLACARDDMLPCLLDFRLMAGLSGFVQAGWMAPLRPELAPILEEAGFQRDWDSELYLFSKEHPSPSPSGNSIV